MCARLGKDSYFFFSLKSLFTSISFRHRLQPCHNHHIYCRKNKLFSRARSSILKRRKASLDIHISSSSKPLMSHTVHVRKGGRYLRKLNVLLQRRGRKKWFSYIVEIYIFNISLTHFFSHRVVSPRFEIFIFSFSKISALFQSLLFLTIKLDFIYFITFFSLEIRLVLYFHTRLDFICLFFFGYILNTFLFIHAWGAF